MNIIAKRGRSENIVQEPHMSDRCTEAMNENLPIETCGGKGLSSPSSFECVVGVTSLSR